MRRSAGPRLVIRGPRKFPALAEVKGQLHRKLIPAKEICPIYDGVALIVRV